MFEIHKSTQVMATFLLGRLWIGNLQWPTTFLLFRFVGCLLVDHNN